MAEFQQFISGGGTDRSGSASQANMTRASGVAQAGQMTADSILQSAQATTDFVATGYDMMKTGATQYAKTEYQTGDTLLNVEGVAPNDISNFNKIESAHRSGKISTDQANIAKRKLGAKILKHNPLADPKDLSANLFGQADFKQTAEEKRTNMVKDLNATYETKTLQDSGLYRTDYSPEQYQGAVEAAIRQQNIIQAYKKTTETGEAKTAEQISAMRNAYVTGTGSTDMFNFIDSSTVALKQELLSISRMNSSPTEKKQMIANAVNNSKRAFQKSTNGLSFFAEGKEDVTAGLSLIDGVAGMYSDDVLSGKLNADAVSNQTSMMKNRFEMDWLKKVGNSPKALALSAQLTTAINGNPGAFVDLYEASKSLSKMGADKILNANTTYATLPSINVEQRATAIGSMFKQPLPDDEDGRVVASNFRASALKQFATMSQEDQSSNITPKFYTDVFSSISNKATFEGMSDTLKESYTNFAYSAGANDYVPAQMQSLQQAIKAKGFDIKKLPEQVKMRVENFKVYFEPTSGDVDAGKVAATLNQSPQVSALNKYGLSSSAFMKESDLVSIYNSRANPALFNIEPTLTEQIGAGVEAAGRVGLATAIDANPAKLLEKAITSETNQDGLLFIADTLNPFRQITGTNSDLAKRLDALEKDLKEQFMKGFKGEK